MKGIVLYAFKDFIHKEYSGTTWLKIYGKVVDNPTKVIGINGNVPDELIVSLIKSSVSVLEISRQELFDKFGDFWINKFIPRHFGIIIEPYRDFKSFINSLNDIHKYMVKELPEAKPPQFVIDWKTKSLVFVEYLSPRGLIDLAISFFKGAGKRFNTDLEIVKRSEKLIEINLK